MTYKESYLEIETVEELKKKIASDITMACITNPDRIKHIVKAGEEVANIKFKGE